MGGSGKGSELQYSLQDQEMLETVTDPKIQAVKQ